MKTITKFECYAQKIISPNTENDNKIACFCNNRTIFTDSIKQNLDIENVIVYTRARYSSLVLLSGY